MIDSLNNKQLALKVTGNGLYGALANQYFRFFDFRCAEGITLTGQYFINRCGTEGAAYIDGISGQQDSLKYIDTDSSYFGTESLLAKADLLKLPTKKLVDVVDTICQKKIGPKLDAICSDICTDLNSFENHLSMKREKICEAGIWVAKKRYALLAWDDEGLRYTEPKVAVTGLEVKRSSTPKMTRKALSDALDIMLKGDEKSLKEYVKSFKSEFMKAPLVDIAIPSGVNGLATYSDPKTIYSKDGCPQHVRASLLYNHYLRTHRIEGIYNPILEGSKMKRVYLRLPNPIGENVIGFIDKLPKEFDLEDYIDYDILFEKTFIQGVKRLADSIGWDYEQKFTLDDFFA